MSGGANVDLVLSPHVLWMSCDYQCRVEYVRMCSCIHPSCTNYKHTRTSTYIHRQAHTRTQTYEFGELENEVKRALLVHSAHVLPCPATHRPEMKPKVVGQTHGANACRHVSVPCHLAVIRGGN